MKTISQLKLKDFLKYPIWTWAEDDDERLIAPVVNFTSLEDYGSLFILSKFSLKDESQISGYIALRAIDSTVYLISIAINTEKFITLPLQPQLSELFDINNFKQEIGKQIDDIFPIRYEAKITDQQVIRGEVSNIFD